MTWIMVDIEADGPIPGPYSMVSLGAVIVDPGLSRTFYAQFHPISEKWDPEALSISGHTREECLTFPNPELGMESFAKWIQENSDNSPRFVSDNNGFDWMFVCWYFWKYTGGCPFGFSSTNLGSVFKGMTSDMRASYKHLVKTPHTHHPVDDAKGCAEVLLHLKDEMGLKISW